MAWILGSGWQRPSLRAGGSDEAEVLVVLRSSRLEGEAAALARAAEVLSRDGLRALRVAAEATRALAACRTRTAMRCGRALAAAGVPAMAWKGESVVRLTHGDPGRRPMADIDLLVPGHGERERAARALEAAGFEPTRHDTALHAVLVDPAERAPGRPAGIAVEVHEDAFAPPHPFGVDVASAFARASVDIATGLLLPSVEDALVLRAFHLVAHEDDARKTLMALRDLALLSERAGEQATWDLARAWDVEALVAAAGERAVAWAGARPWLARPVPPASTWRRRLGVALAAAELDAGIATTAPAPRVLSRRPLAALWWPGRLATVAALARGARRGGAAARRIGGAVRAAGAALRGGGG